MGAPSLVNHAQQLAIKHIDAIQSFADTPLGLLRPILRHVQSPEQLRTLEEESPQIVGEETTALWKKFIDRDISGGNKDGLEPRNPLSWWKVYRKLKREDEQRKAEAEARLKAAFQQHKTERESNQATFIAQVLPTDKKRKSGWGKAPAPKSATQNALSAMRKANGRTAPHAASSSSNREQVRGSVAAAPANMVNQYLRASNKAPVTASPHPLLIRNAAQPRNPFKTYKKTGPSIDQVVLDRAVRAEREKRARETASASRMPTTANSSASQRSIATSAGPARPASQPSQLGAATSPAKPQGSPSRVSGSSTASVDSAQPKPAAVAVKRKVPNIFMAQTKRAKR